MYTTAALVLVAIFAYRFHRPLLAVLARFDSRNVARKVEEWRDRHDRFAHFRHTLKLAEEQVDEITEIAVTEERTGAAIPRYLFAGESFATREDAEVARKESVLAKARQFYEELPVALSRRGDGQIR